MPVSPCRLPPWCHHGPVSQPSTGRGEWGWQGARKGPALPHTCRVTKPWLVTHGCSLPTPRQQRCHTPPPLQKNLAPCPGNPASPEEGAVGTPRRKERHAPRREGAPEETGEPRRREPRNGAAAAREGEARTHVRGGRWPPASAGVPGTAWAGWGGAAAREKWGRRMNFSPAPPLFSPPTCRGTSQPQTTRSGRSRMGSGEPQEALQSLQAIPKTRTNYQQGFDCRTEGGKSASIPFPESFQCFGEQVSHTLV